MSKALFLYNNYLQMWEEIENQEKSLDDMKQDRSFLKMRADNEVENIRRENIKNQGAQINAVGASGVTVASQADALDDMEVQARQKEDLVRRQERKEARSLSSKIAETKKKKRYGLFANVLSLSNDAFEKPNR